MKSQKFNKIIYGLLSLEPVWCKSKANLKDTGAVLEKVDEATEKITVIINATAEEVTKDVKISKAAPAVASAKFVCPSGKETG